MAGKVPIPINRPLLPACERLLPYLRRVDEARYYTNYGQLEAELAARLAAHLGAQPGSLVLANSGTSAITGAILAVAGRALAKRSLCICPAYTFVATAVAAAACGYEPYFVDIDPLSWTTGPERLDQLPAVAEAGVVVVVAPYGRMVDVRAWDEFSRRHGVPVVIDAAGCFDSLDVAAIAECSVLVAVSLHATKTFSTAEGGLVLCGSVETARRVTRTLNFGFFESRQSEGPSINGKLSEYHAAVGLAELDTWSEKCQNFLRVARDYRAAAQLRGLDHDLFTDCQQASAYALYCAASPGHARRITLALDENHIGSRLWYGLGLHRQPEFSACRHDNLGVTDDLAARLIGLPMAVDMSRDDVGRVTDVIAAA